MKKFISAIHKVSYFLSWIASGALLFMTVITTIDVFARYLFNNPILGSNELVESAMVVFVYGAMAHATIARSHICANVLDPVLSKRQREILGAFAFALAGITFALMTWRTIIEAGAAMTNLQEQITLTLRMPIGPLYIFIAFGLVMLCIEIVFDVLRRINDVKAATKAMANDKENAGDDAQTPGGMI